MTHQSGTTIVLTSKYTGEAFGGMLAKSSYEKEMAYKSICEIDYSARNLPAREINCFFRGASGYKAYTPGVSFRCRI